MEPTLFPAFMNKKILVVDDDLAILEVVKIILEDEGYIIYTLSDGENILETVSTITPDLILLDFWLPAGLDGGEIAKLLKNKEGTKNIPIVMISANHNIETTLKNIGVNSFLAKPFNIEDLITVVQKHIN